MATDQDDEEYYINTLSDLEDSADELDEILGDIGTIYIPSIEELKDRYNDVTITELFNYMEKYERNQEIYEAEITKLGQLNEENSKRCQGSVIDIYNRMFNYLVERESDCIDN